MPATPIDAAPIDSGQIVITASRAPEQQAQSPASVTVIDSRRIERLDEPLARALLRLVPSTAVSSSGPAGSLTDVRIRGAEANHTLLFIDGIRANDPATGDQPRFDLLNADVVSRIEVVRGPQSALWGSEAIGGVVAINGLDDARGYLLSAEGGSFGFARAAASESISSSRGSLSAALGTQRATGIDSFDGHGDKDGYRNLSGRLRATWKLGPSVELGAAAFGVTAKSEFDGFDPVTFAHADTLDNSRSRLGAARIWAQFGDEGSGWSGRIGSSLLGSSNRNFLAEDEINLTSGSRRTIDAQVEHRFTTGPVTHRLIAAADGERETFHARDTGFGGFTDQDRARGHDALTVEWRGETKALAGDLAVRRDIFSRFKDATTLRASALAKVGGGFSVAGSYGKGIAQPTFFDLYGFFPGSFVGNQSLKPESSRGFEVSLRYRRGTFEASLTGYRQRLHDEIVPNATFTSTLNAAGTSRRSGVEVETAWHLAEKLRLLANYAYLHATEPASFGTGQAPELRRPKHSGSIALDGQSGRLTYGASIAYVSAHLDARDVPPFDVLSLRSYWLGGTRVAYAVLPGIELFARAANAFDARYQDVSGYRTEGRSVYAGIRLSSRR
jgi:vitamin B12 transporter